jgi:hypothetical protein
MYKLIFLLLISLFISGGCVDEEADLLGDLLVRVELSDQQLPLQNIEIGIFPTEAIIRNEYTADLAIKSAAFNDQQAVITDILPGTYVVAFIVPPGSATRKQVTQIIADEVALVDFDFRPFND